MSGVSVLFIAAAVFFVTVLGQIWMVNQVRRRLTHHHPEIWLQVSRETGFFTSNPTYRFLRKRLDRQIDDPVLSRLARRYRLLFACSFIAWLAAVVTVIALQQGYWL